MLSQELTGSFENCACIPEMLHQLQRKKKNARDINKKIKFLVFILLLVIGQELNT
jgi:hypothetical protein